LSRNVDNSTYIELKNIAASYMRGERLGHTLSPTALVNEAYLRSHSVSSKGSVEHRFYLASVARDMRQILVDHARARRAEKRGGGVPAMTLHEELHASPIASNVDILALHDALEKLAGSDAIKVNIVEMRYFAGMTLEEIAQHLDISIATVKRKWTAARAWLFRELTN